MRGKLITLIGAAMVATGTPAMASHKGWDNASSIGADTLAVVALGVPTVQGDWSGLLQAGESIGAAAGIAAGLKEIFPEERPDHSDNKSFPSSHAALSFAAAATLQNRYGWEVGLPAQLLATFVSVARVKAQKHHWYDVVAGAALGESSGFLLTSKRDQNVRVVPWGDSHGGGLSMSARF